ncbi:MAG TPA: hypothetical protein VKQ30_19440 [Ktedonobacterales bacterium]|nr:hypothetical protein [Ktedonobacterales bacterium]
MPPIDFVTLCGCAAGSLLVIALLAVRISGWVSLTLAWYHHTTRQREEESRDLDD